MLCTAPSPCAKPKRSPAAQGASGCTEELRKPPGHTSPRPRSTQRSPREGSPAPRASGCAGGRPHRTESLPSSTVLSQGIAQRASQGTAGTTPARTDRRTCGGEQDKQAVTPQKRRGALPSISQPAEPSRPKPPPASPAPRGPDCVAHPSPEVRRAARLGRGRRGTHTHTTHLRRIQGPHPASGQPGRSPASSRPAPGGSPALSPGKNPPRPSRSPSPRARKKETALPTTALFTKSWFQSTRENSRSISRPCFHSADTHYL